MVDFPAPEGPTSPMAWPGFTENDRSWMISSPLLYENVTCSKLTLPVTAGRGLASGRSVTSSGRSNTSNTRWAAARAFWMFPVTRVIRLMGLEIFTA